MFLPSQGKSIAPTIVYLSSTREKPLRRDRCRWSTEITLSQFRQSRKPLLVLCCMCSSYFYGISEVAQRDTYSSISTSDLKFLAEKAPHHVQLAEACVQNSLGRVGMHPSLPWPCLQHYHKAPSAPSHALSPTQPTSLDTLQPCIHQYVTLQVALLAIQQTAPSISW